jgi:hypothetical protein
MPSKDCDDARSASVSRVLAQLRSFLSLVKRAAFIEQQRGCASRGQHCRVRCSPASTNWEDDHWSYGHRREPTAGGQALAKRMGALLAAYDLAISGTQRVLRGETDDV